MEPTFYISPAVLPHGHRGRQAFPRAGSPTLDKMRILSRVGPAAPPLEDRGRGEVPDGQTAQLRGHWAERDSGATSGGGSSRRTSQASRARPGAILRCGWPSWWLAAKYGAWAGSHDRTVGRLRRASSCARWAGRKAASARGAPGARFPALPVGGGAMTKPLGQRFSLDFS
jgi:hypothetical protein